MLDSQLFFGFPVDSTYQALLDKKSPSLLSLFIKDHPDYLYYIEERGTRYLGKKIGPRLEVSKLDLNQNHIYSLLKRLVPEYPYETIPLALFAVLDTPTSVFS